MRKILIGFFLLCTGCALFGVALWRLTDGFSLAHIQSTLKFAPRWEVANQDERAARDLLAQNFYYIGKGSQCYVFASEDGDVVLKFFRHSRYRLHPLARYITAPAFITEFQQKREREKQHKLDFLFTSCLIAHQELREESGLIYLHLNKTDHLKQQVVLYDKLKRAHPIAIDEYEFMIQKKGEQIFPYLTHLLSQGKQQEAKQALTDLVALLNRRIHKGIADTDAVIHKNSGFRGQKALFLDVGGFAHGTPADPQAILLRTTRKLRSWLSTHDPELAGYFEEALANHPGKASLDVCDETPFLIKSIPNM